MKIETIAKDARHPDYDVVSHRFNYEALRADMQYIKESKHLTYEQMGKKCYCHPQSVYKFISGEYAQLGDKLRWRFIWFVRQNWDLPIFQQCDIAEPRYASQIIQYRLPNF